MGKVGEVYNLSGYNEKNMQIMQKILSKLGKSDKLITHVADRKGHDQRYTIDSIKAN